MRTGLLLYGCAVFVFLAGTGAGAQEFNVKVKVDGAVADATAVQAIVQRALAEAYGNAETTVSPVSAVPPAEGDGAPSSDAQTPPVKSEQAPALPGENETPRHLFDPLMADPRWSHFSASWLHYEGTGEEIGSANFGALLAPPYIGNVENGAFQPGIQAGVFSVFDLETSSNDLANSDFYVAVPLMYRYRDFSVIGRLFHQSSHLGDEFILNHDIGADDRINLSYEGLDVTLSYEINYPGEKTWRIYGGSGRLLRTDPGDLERWSIHYGLEFRSPWTFPANHFAGMRFRPVAGVDLKNREENSWNTDVSARGGLEIEEFLGKPLRSRYQILFEYFRGHSPNGQFFREEIEYMGVGLHAYLF